MRLYLQYTTTLIMTLFGFQHIYAQIDSLDPNKGDIAAIIKECATGEDINVAKKCTEQRIYQLLIKELKLENKVEKTGKYVIDYTISSFHKPEVGHVIKIPRTVKKGDEEVLSATLQKIIEKQEWVPILQYFERIHAGAGGTLTINLEELK